MSQDRGIVHELMNMSVKLATLLCNMMEEQALLHRLDVDQDAPTVCQMTDVEIVQMVQ